MKLERLSNPFSYRLGRAVRNATRLIKRDAQAGRKVTAAEMAAEARPGCGTCHGRGHYRVLARNLTPRAPELRRGAMKRTGPTRAKVARRAPRTWAPTFNRDFPEVCGCARNRFANRHALRVMDDAGHLAWVKGEEPRHAA